MLPFVSIGPFAIPTHDLFVVLGAVVAVLVFAAVSRRSGEVDERLVWVALGALVGGALAAKMSTVWRYLSLAPDPSFVGALVYGGKSVLGGLAGAYVGAVLVKRLVGYRASTGDLFAPAVAAGMAVGRWGCFLTEQLGTPSALPWALTLDAEAAARIPGAIAGVPCHPSFLYEIAFHAAAVPALLWLQPRVAVRGDAFKLYLLGYGLFRFAVEFVRGNEPVALGLSFSQLFLIPSTLLLLGYFLVQRLARTHEPPPLGQPAARAS